MRKLRCTRLTFRHCAFAILMMASQASAQSAPSSDTLMTLVQRRGYTAVPLTPAPEYGDGQYTVPVTLGSISATLLFDSGFNGVLTIHQDQADQAGLHGTGAGTVEGITGKSSTDTAHVKEFGIGPMHFGSQPVSIGRFPMADGAIGSYFISTYGAILDYSHDMLYLKVRPHATKHTLSLKRPGDVVIPMKRVNGMGERTGYYVEAMVNGVPRLFLLDTGWGGASFNLDQERAAAFGLQGPAHGRFKLGMIEVETDFSLSDLSQVRKKQQSVGMPQLDGVIGCGFLKERGAIIDFANNVLYLRGQ